MAEISGEELQDKILEIVDMTIGMVVESAGQFTSNTMTMPLRGPSDVPYELVITFRKKENS